MKIGSEYYWYQNDHLGTPQKMTTSSGAVVWSAKYNSFGNAAVDAASNSLNNLRFAGQYYDSETGLHYNYFRYYDPKLGRYLRADPIGLDGGINLYSYVENNPVNLIDPFGLKDRKSRRRNRAYGQYTFLRLGASMQASHNSPSPPVSPEEWKAIQNLLDNISNFFPGQLIMVPPQEIFKKGCPQDYNG